MCINLKLVHSQGYKQMKDGWGVVMGIRLPSTWLLGTKNVIRLKLDRPEQALASTLTVGFNLVSGISDRASDVCRFGGRKRSYFTNFSKKSTSF